MILLPSGLKKTRSTGDPSGPANESWRPVSASLMRINSPVCGGHPLAVVAEGCPLLYAVKRLTENRELPAGRCVPEAIFAVPRLGAASLEMIRLPSRRKSHASRLFAAQTELPVGRSPRRRSGLCRLWPRRRAAGRRAKFKRHHFARAGPATGPAWPVAAS